MNRNVLFAPRPKERSTQVVRKPANRANLFEFSLEKYGTGLVLLDGVRHARFCRIYSAAISRRRDMNRNVLLRNFAKTRKSTKSLRIFAREGRNRSGFTLWRPPRKIQSNLLRSDKPLKRYEPKCAFRAPAKRAVYASRAKTRKSSKSLRIFAGKVRDRSSFTRWRPPRKILSNL